MSIVQASYRFPIPEEKGYESLVEHQKEAVRSRFGLELIKALTERGGIVGPIHEEEARQKDWLWDSGVTFVTLTFYAKLTEMPEPESYRFMGGPADGQIGRTGGATFWRVPYMPRVSVADAYDMVEQPRILYADYERDGDTQVYYFKGINA